MKNTKHLCEATVFIYPSKNKYIGVCLELDLVDEDSDKEALSERMKSRIQSYISYIEKKKFDDSFLNRPAPKKYWDKFYKFLYLMRAEEKKRASCSMRVKDFAVYRENLEPELA